MAPTVPNTAGGDLPTGLPPDSEVASSGDLPAPFAEAQILGLALALSAALVALLRPFGLAGQPRLPFRRRDGGAGKPGVSSAPGGAGERDSAGAPSGVDERDNADAFDGIGEHDAASAPGEHDSAGKPTVADERGEVQEPGVTEDPPDPR